MGKTYNSITFSNSKTAWQWRTKRVPNNIEKSAERPFWNCRKEAFAWVSASFLVAMGKTTLPNSKTAWQWRTKRVPNNTENVPNVPSKTVERKLLHEFLLLLLTLVAMGKTYNILEQQNSMAVKDKTGAKQYRKSADRPVWNCRKEAFAWVSATASNSCRHGKNLHPPKQQNSMAVKDKTDAKQHRKCAERPF